MKKNNNKGFTLMEMLIVVAIIAILIAIAIPTFTNNLKKAEDAADQANGRALYAALSSAMMLDGDNFTAPTVADDGNGSKVEYQGTTYTFNSKCSITADKTTGEITVTVGQQSTSASQVFSSKAVDSTSSGGSGSGSNP